MRHEGFLSTAMLLFEEHSCRAVVREAWRQVRQGKVFGRSFPRDGHRYFLVVLSRVAVVDLIFCGEFTLF
ncbi:hypothetical protein C4Q28_23590 [Pseudomonas sp. SWI6]|nr:hypothetical protein PVLB_03370 [Pseudomonas sp. VLB120]AVD84935.1 hypothetical protein C4Q28_23590 [Pseudomonas sp. SWI6]